VTPDGRKDCSNASSAVRGIVDFTEGGAGRGFP
jgi:hypothetical protein